MKNSYLLLVVFLLPLFVLSQGNLRPIALEDPAFNAYFENGATVPVVTGKLINASAQEISQATINYYLVTPFSDLEVQKSAQVARDGTFKLTLDYAFPYQEIFMSVGDYCYFGILANKDLYIELDVTKLKALNHSDTSREGVKYLGTDGELNSYKSDFHCYKRRESLELHRKKNNLVSDYKLDSINFNRQFDSVFAEFKHIEKEYTSVNPSSYSWILENERLSDYYGQLCLRNWNKIMDENLWKRVNMHKSFLVSLNGMMFYRYLYAYIRSLPINSSSVFLKEFVLMKDLSESDKVAIDSANYYQKVIKELSNDTVRHIQKVAKFIQFQKNLQPRLNQLTNEKVNNKIVPCLDSLFATSKADFLKLQIGSKDPFEQKNIYTYSLSSMHTNWTKKILNTEYQQTVTKIGDINKSLSFSSSKVTSLGFGDPIMQTPFGASLYKISCINASEFLAKSMSTFPNKALVLDFWATWCGPCLAEMPYSKKLHEESKGLPVEFIYLCTSANSDESTWKAKIAELKQPGIHYFVDETLENELMNLFSFSGFPNYAFIDKNGQYKPSAISRMSLINKDQLIELINTEQPVKL